MLRIGTYSPELDWFMDEVYDGQRRSPGLIDDIWGCGDTIASVEKVVEATVRSNEPVKEKCRELGIRFSFQQGSTLGHAPGVGPVEGFPDDAWAVNLNGKRAYGIFCATSPFARDYNRRKAEGIIRALQPASYWPDDDLRLDKHPPICFCERCLKLFGEKTGRTWTREALCAAIFGNPGDGAVRKAWAEFNAENVAGFAETYRVARDAAKRDCRLGEQAAYSGQTYSGCYQRKVQAAYSGPDHDPVSIRAGAVYYMDRDPMKLFEKQLDVAREAARSRKWRYVDQVCYEAEKWPHCGSMKSAGGEWLECSAALAAGCDSLAVYWSTSSTTESREFSRFWVNELIAWKPFLLSVRDAFKGTEVAGAAMFHGSGFFDLPEWGEGLGWSASRNHDDPASIRLVENSVPMCAQEGEPDVHVLNTRAVRTLKTEDLPALFAKPVMMDAPAFREFAKRFPDHELFKSVEIVDISSGVVSGVKTGVVYHESFGEGIRSRDVHGAYRAKKGTDVRTYSRICGRTSDGSRVFPVEGAAGTCLVRLPSGAKVVLCQCINEKDCFFPWSGYRRHAIMDALDDAVPGKLPVRLVTDSFRIAVTARKDANGHAAGAFLVNAATGETPPVELALRGSKKDWRVRLPKGEWKPAKVLRASESETVIEIPPLYPWQCVLVAR